MKVARYLQRGIQNSRRCQITQLQLASIYIKDKDLDKSKYKQSETDQLNNYLKNYKQSDPKPLSEEELKVFQEKEEQERKGREQRQKEEAVKGEAPFLNRDKLLDLFDQMVEIDSDPNSKRAQDYYKKLEEIERKNPNKKKSEIIIKTRKSLRTDQNDRLKQLIGGQLTKEEEEFQKKFIDWKSIKFPEINPVNMTAKSDGKEVKIANYRYPSANPNEKRGIIYFVHGYGDYCGRYAYLAKYFAEAGYDFVGMDQKGFGNSEGKRAFIESEDKMIEEHLKYFELVDKQYGGKDVPKFQIGNSLGGLITLKLSLAQPEMFKGLGLIAPYIELKNPDTFKKYEGVAKFIDKIYPSYNLKQRVAPKKEVPKRFREYLSDPLLEIDNLPVHNLLVNQDASKKFKEKEMDQVKTPFIMVLAGQDKHVSNKAARNFFDIAPIQDKDVITYDDAEHNIIMDNEYLPMIAKDFVAWFNTHC